MSFIKTQFTATIEDAPDHAATCPYAQPLPDAVDYDMTEHHQDACNCAAGAEA